MVAIVTVGGSQTGLLRSSGNILGAQGQIGSAALGQNGDRVAVDAADGNLVVQSTDAMLFGVGLNDVVTNTYNSLATPVNGHVGVTGAGWWESFQRTLTNFTGTLNATGSTITRVAADGSQFVYTWSVANGAYVGNEGDAFDTLTFNSSTNQWTWLDRKTQTTEIYDAANGNRLISSQGSGGSLTFAYNGAGQLTSITTLGGEYTSFVYNASGLLTSVASNYYVNGATGGGLTQQADAAYAYNANNKLTSVTVNSASGSYVTTYAYGTGVGSIPALTSISQSDGTNLAISYVSNTNEVSSFVQTISSGATQATSLSYGAGQTIITDPLGNQTVMNYDAQGDLTYLTAPAAASGSQPQSLQFTYDSNGNVLYAGGYGDPDFTSITNNWANLSVSGFGVTTTQSTEVDGGVNVYRRVTNSTPTSGFSMFLGQSLGIAAPVSAGQTVEASVAVSSLNASAVTLSIHWYNSSKTYIGSTSVANLALGGSFGPGGTANAVRGGGFVTAISGAAYAQLLVVATSNGHGPLNVAIAQPVLQPGASASAGSSYQGSPAGMTYTYDGVGDVLTISNAASGQITYTYTANVQVSTATTSLGVGASSTVRYVYQSGNLLAFVISPMGEVTQYIRNSVGEVLSEIQYTSQADIYNTSGLTSGQSPTYSTMLSWAAGLTDLATTKRTDMTYDVRGDVASVTTYATTNSDGSGNAATATETLNLLYTPTGKVLERELVASSGQMETFSYDALNRLVSSTDFNGKSTGTSYGYSATGTTKVVTLANGTTETSVYNLANELTSYTVTGADGTMATTSYTYDKVGRLYATTDPTGLTSYILYDGDGRKAADIASNGAITEYGYTPDNLLAYTVQYATPLNASQLSQLAQVGANGTPPSLASVTPTANPTSDRWSWRIYDRGDRLAETIDARGDVTAYTYDNAGNLITTTAYAAQLTSQIAGFQTTPPMAQVLPAATPGADRVTTNYYDADNRLVGVLDADGYVTQTIYDDAGQKTQAIAYANKPSVTSGTFASIVASITTSVSDVHSWYVYDQAGNLRISIVGSEAAPADVTRYDNYTANGQAGTVTRGQQASVATLLTSPPTLSSSFSAPTWGALDVTNYTYDEEGHVLAKTLTLAGGTETTTYSYDKVYNLVSKTTASSTAASGGADPRTTTYRYNGLGQLVGELTGNGSAALAALGSSPTPAQINAVWAAYGATYTYDAAGRMTSKTNADGDRTLYYYGVDGRLTYEINPDGDVTQYGYDAFGDKTDTTVYDTPIAATTLAGLTGGQITSTLTSAIVPSGNDRHTHTDFNVTGTVADTIDATSAETTYSYDAFGDMHVEAAPLSTGVTVQTTDVYDQMGQLQSSMLDSAAGGLQLKTSYAYDAFGRVTSTTNPNSVVTTTSYDGSGDTLSQTVDPGGLNLSTSWTYDGVGNVLTKTDATGATTSYAYTAFNRQITVTDPNGVVTTTTNNAYGQTVKVVDGDGNATVYAYDADGNLTSKTDALGNVTTQAFDNAGRLIRSVVNSGGLNLTTQYTYDNNGAVLSKTDANGNVTRYVYNADNRLIYMVDGAGDVTQTSYDADGRVLSRRTYAQKVSASTLSAWGLTITAAQVSAAVSTSTPSNDAVTSSVYDPGGRLQYSIDGAGAVTGYTYDNAGNVLTKTQYATEIAPPSGGVYTAAYVQSQVNSASRVTSYTYDADNRVVFTIDASGAVIGYAYDAAGNLIQQIQYATNYGSTGAQSLATMQSWRASTPSGSSTTVAGNPANRITTTVYDDAGRVAFSIDAVGAVTGYSYDADGRVTQTIQYATPDLVTTTQTLASMQSWVVTNANAAASAGISDRVTRAIYDAAGRVVYTVDPDGYITTYQYNAAGQVTQTTRYSAAYFPKNGDPHYELARLFSEEALNGLPALSVWALWAGQLASSVTATQMAQTVVTSSQFLTDTNGMSNAQLVSYIYSNLAVPLSAATQSADAAALANGTLTLAGLLLNVVQIAQANGFTATPSQMAAYLQTYPSSTTQVTHKVYNTAGRLAFTIDPAGAVCGYVCDALGNVEQKIEYATLDTTASTWANFSEMQSWASANASPSDHVTQSIYDGAGRLLYSIDAGGYITFYQYDGVGRLTQKSSTSTVYALTEGTNPTAATIAGYLISNPPAQTETTVYTYDADGHVLTTTDATVALTTNVYDAFGDTIQITDPRRNSGYFFYDALGRQTLEVDAGGYVTATSYDLSNQVVSVTRYGAAVVWTPNTTTPPTPVTASAFNTANPNATPVQDDTTTITRDQLGRVTAATDAQNNKTSYVLDAFGDQTTITNVLGGVTTQVFDGRGLMTSKTVNNSWTVNGAAQTSSATTTYQYDAFGNKTLEQIEATGLSAPRTTIYGYDLDNRLTSTTSDTFSASNDWAIAGVGDLNGDGKTDVLWRNMTTGDVRALESPLGGGSSSWVDLGTLSSDWTIAGVGDFDGDGKADILLRNNTTREVGAWESSKGGGASSYVKFGIGDAGWTIAGVGDFNGDGKADVLWWNAATRAIGAWESTPGGGFSFVGFGTAGAGWTLAAVGDFDGDGKSDILWRDAATGGVGAWESSLGPLGSSSSWASFLTGGVGWTIAGVGDFDGDGKSDILWWNAATGGVGTWESSRGSLGTASSWASFGTGSSGWTIAGVGDFDGDRKADILWRNAATGGVGAWESSLGPLGSPSSWVPASLPAASTTVTPVTQHVYDRWGNVIETIDATGAQTFFYYNSKNQKVGQIDALGDLTSWTYDAFGNVQSQTQYATPVANLIADPGFANIAQNWNTSWTSDGTATAPVPTQSTIDGVSVLTRQSSSTPASGWQMSLEPSAAHIPVSAGQIVMASAYFASTKASIVKLLVHWYDASGSLITSSLAGSTATAGSFANGVSGAAFVTGSVVAPPNAVSADFTVVAVANGSGPLSISMAEPTLTLVPATLATNDRRTTYTYDGDNRQRSSMILANGNLTVGAWNGTSWGETTANVTTQTFYDANGDVIQQIDGNGNSTYTYYDALGRKVAQVGQSGYLTTYTLDAEGNVLTQTQYATALSGPFTAGGVPPTPPAVSVGNDRITTFTYDHDGRRLTESRLNVTANTVSGDNVTGSTGASTITYTYDGLGDVLTKTHVLNPTQGTGDTTIYAYDNQGRQVSQTNAVYTDYTGATVQQQTLTTYDGLGEVTRMIVGQAGKITPSDAAGTAGEEISSFTYDAAGRLASSTDATGFLTTYGYDADGRKVVQSYSRLHSDGTSSYETLVTGYDALGLVVQQVTADQSNGVLTFGATADAYYDAFGEVVARGTNTQGNIQNAQEFAQYDNAGRVWRTNFNDGVTKVYVYDANGNATLLLQSLGGVDLKSYANLNAVFTATGGSTPTVTETISVYDARNELIDTKQPSSTNTGDNPVAAIEVNTAGGGVQYFNSSAGVVSAANATPTGATAGTIGSASNGATSTGGNITFSVTDTGSFGTSSYPALWGEYYSVSVALGNSSLSTVNGGGQLSMVVTVSEPGGASNPGSHGTWVVNATSGSTSISLGSLQQYYDWGSSTVTVQLYQNLDAANQKLLAQAGPLYTSSSVNTATTTVHPTLEIQNLNPNATALRMYVRPHGSTGPYYYTAGTPVTTSTGATMHGWFSADLTQWPFSTQAAGTWWDVQYQAMDVSGNVYDAKWVVVDGNGNNISGFNAMAVGGPGQAALTQDGYLILSGLPTNTTGGTIYYRAAGSNGAWSQPNPPWLGGGGYGQNGFWSFYVGNLSGPIEYWIETSTSSGPSAQKLYGQFTVGGQATALTQYVAASRTVQLFPPSGQGVGYQRFRYQQNGVWSAWIGYNGGGTWNYDASALSNFYSDQSYAIQYETYTAQGGALISQASGTLTLGYDGQSVSNWTNTQSGPAKVAFAPQQTGVDHLTLYWRDENWQAEGLTGQFNVATVSNVGGTFAWNVDTAVDAAGKPVRPASSVRNLEYYYDAYNASGALLPPLYGDTHVHGYLSISSNLYTNTGNNQIEWQIQPKPGTSFLIDRKQSFDAFGDIVSETNGDGAVTTLSYNALGKLTVKTDPQIAVTDETGATTNATPTEYYYYDLAGRQVGQRDANGNLTTQTLLAGSGYDGASALTLSEYHPDTGIRSTTYDVFGNARTLTDETGAVTTNVYDKANRLIEVDHPLRSGGNSPGVQLIDHYGYDGLGERITHTDNVNGSVAETADYDAQGRVVKTVSFGGQTTTYIYNWENGSSATIGPNNFVGWQKTTSTAGGEISYEDDDVFGHVAWRQDLGGHTYSYTYNSAGQLVHQSNTAGQSIDYTYDTNGYISSVTDNALHVKSTYEYDNDGNRTLEAYNSTDASPIFYENAAISYNAMGWVTEVNDPKADITYKYDKNGNRREMKSVYSDGIVGDPAPPPQDYWYKYDSMNRFVITMGSLVNGAITTGTTGGAGVALTYDARGDRMSATYASDGHAENYSYTTDGYLENVTIGGVLRVKRTNDALGRETSYAEYQANGALLLTRAMIYDGDNRVTAETDQAYNSSGALTSTSQITNDYGAYVAATGGYTGADQGVITHSKDVQTPAGGGSAITTNTTYAYQWWDQAQQASITLNATDPSNPNSGQWAPGVSQMSYDVNGHLTQAVDQAGGRVINYANDAYGQVLVREETDHGVLGPRQLYYYLDGHRIGDVSNNGPSPSQEDYAQELAAKAGPTLGKGSFRAFKPVASANFDQNYQPINEGYPAQAPVSYTVQAGDTLQSIALAQWGDASLWYLIADANGLSANAVLVAGQVLSLPDKVTNLHNNSSTVHVYNPGEAIGDNMPTLPAEPLLPPPPAPKHGGGCGVLGDILAVVVAIVVFVVTKNALTAAKAFEGVAGAIGIATTVAASAVAGAASSVASQLTEIAVGNQSKFNWGGVALGAIGGGVTAGLPSIPGVQQLDRFVGTGLTPAVNAGIGSAITQGIGVATGLQHKFDWAAVAVSSVSAGVAHYAAGYLPQGLGDVGRGLIAGAAGAISGSAAQSLLTGKDFGDVLVSTLPGVIGQTIGNAIAGQEVQQSQQDVLDNPLFSSSQLAQIDAMANGDTGLTPQETAYIQSLGSTYPSGDSTVSLNGQGDGLGNGAATSVGAAQGSGDVSPNPTATTPTGSNGLGYHYVTGLSGDTLLVADNQSAGSDGAEFTDAKYRPGVPPGQVSQYPQPGGLKTIPMDPNTPKLGGLWGGETPGSTWEPSSSWEAAANVFGLVTDYNNLNNQVLQMGLSAELNRVTYGGRYNLVDVNFDPAGNPWLQVQTGNSGNVHLDYAYFGRVATVEDPNPSMANVEMRYGFDSNFNTVPQYRYAWGDGNWTTDAPHLVQNYPDSISGVLNAAGDWFNKTIQVPMTNFFNGIVQNVDSTRNTSDPNFAIRLRAITNPRPAVPQRH